MILDGNIRSDLLLCRCLTLFDGALRTAWHDRFLGELIGSRISSMVVPACLLSCLPVFLDAFCVTMNNECLAPGSDQLARTNEGKKRVTDRSTHTPTHPKQFLSKKIPIGSGAIATNVENARNGIPTGLSGSFQR